FIFIIGVRLLFPPHSADKSQREHDSSVLFEFKVPLQEDPLLHNMLSFLRNDQDMNPIFEVSSSWFKSHPVLSDLELKIKNFASFANANSKSKEVVFIATCASDLNDSRAIDKAAVIKKCISGTPFSEFDLPSKPEMLTCHNVEDNKVELQWKVQAFGSVNVEKYKVGYRSTDEHDYTYIITKENKKFITINQLKPETSYVFKVCAQTAMGHSEWSKLLRGANALPA
uniref:Fibronectin type-III domain-containing protein n=1 Tax=Amphimedon queenslandica TaxID=400682 RepID=A0A1X7SFC2_AMPQE